MPRIALIHALAHSPPPINAEFERRWPEARRMNLLDDSLSADLARAGAIDAAMTQRFIRLADYAVDAGADAILFTCSAFGPCIDAVKQRHAALPVLKPNEAMVDEALQHQRQQGGRIGLLATFGPTLASMPAEFGPGVPMQTALADGALAALDAGDVDRHDQLAADAAAALVQSGCTLIALAQFSLARAAPAVVARCAVPVLTTPASAVQRLRRLLGA